MEHGVTQLGKLAAAVCEGEHKIDRIGMPNFFVSKNGQDFLETLELKNNVRKY